MAGNSPIHYAHPECLAIFDSLLAHSANVDAKNSRGRTVLMTLMTQFDTKRDIKVLEKLIECGADVNVSDVDGNNILHLIMQNLRKFKTAHLPFLKTLIRAGADLNKQNNNGVPPLLMYDMVTHSWRFEKEGEECLFQQLIKLGMDINTRDRRGHNILFQVKYSDQCKIEKFEKLIELGADATAVAKDGSSLLHEAIKYNPSIEWIRYLVSKGVDPCLKDSEGRTLVHLAISACYDWYRSSMSMVEELVKLGISPEDKDRLGRTALHFASLNKQERDLAQHNDESWIDIVLDTPMFKVNVNSRDDSGSTALHYAAEISESSVAKLLRAGADPLVITSEGLSLLHVACQACQPNIVGLLLATCKEMGKVEQIIDLHTTAGKQETSLHMAARSGVPESVSFLLNYGARVTSIDQNRYTPLHALTEFAGSRKTWPLTNENEMETLQILLAAGADPSAQAILNEREVTPLDLAAAAENKCEAIIQALLQYDPRNETCFNFPKLG